ncbi:MAG: hypothetical protein IKJ68_06925 [Clostridia bacterium]|nr:hypothetical protein [Bacilli bacterium]MBR3933624.1 hypothetical protein [Clostridia bacterium]
MAKSKKKETGFIACNVSIDRKNMIQKAAKDLGLSVSGLMNVAINDYLKANKIENIK